MPASARSTATPAAACAGRSAISTSTASTIDPDIPSGAFTAREIIDKQLLRAGLSNNSTRTVDGLVEAALYFRGAKVGNGGADLLHTSLHKPDSWNAVEERYGNGRASAALPASYAPNPGYAPDVRVPGNYGMCRDYSGGGTEGQCGGGKVTYDCVGQEPASGTWVDDSGNVRTWTTSGYTDCKYEHPDDWLEPSYISPITQSCQANAIVLISDGLPNRTPGGWPLQEIIGTDVDGCEDLRPTIFGSGSPHDGNCGPEVVREMATHPQVPGVPGSTVTTYTVGFGLGGAGEDYLDLLAAEGGGKYFDAGSADELADALDAILADIGVGGSQSFGAPSVDIDRASFSSADRAYFTLFEPSVRRGWQGNLKGYFTGPDGFVDTNGRPAIASTPDGARFAVDAQSFWSDEIDGDSVSAGGASARLLDGERTLYTYLGDNDTIPAGGVALAGIASRRLDASNASLRAADLGLPAGSPERNAALDWLRSAPMGDPLHSRSVSIDYGTRQVVYVMTNQGLLHAIDASAPVAPGDHGGGREIFAFMPDELLTNLPLLAANASGGDHVYGLDGTITRWHDDANNDGVVNGADRMLLVLGMRRGGDAYHALDVTDPAAPRLAWTIDSDTPGFERLAQSWSRAALVNVERGGGEERVLMFGGGYDAAALDDRAWPREARGNAVFVVDRLGDLIRRFDQSDHAEMRYSLAADLTVIDSDADGAADRIYAADLGGQVWRIDFADIASAAGSRVTRLADLHDGTSQPFFYAPSVALDRDAHGKFLSVSLGSGNRTEPLDTGTANAFFMLRDTDVDVGEPAPGFTTIDASELYDASTDAFGSDEPGVADAARDALDAARGWRLALAPGEKSLSRLTSFEGELMGTTYQVDGGALSDPCDFASTGRFYRMDIATARPVERAEDGTLVQSTAASERSKELAGRGIPSEPVVLFPPEMATPQIVVDSEIVGRIEQQIEQVYWYAR